MGLYPAVLLIIVALVRWVPYWPFDRTPPSRVAYLALFFHTVVLLQVGYWATPLGMLTAGLLAGGTVALRPRFPQ